MTYATPINADAPQSDAARIDQVQNNAGGYVFTVSPRQHLDRFLILGTDASTYYVTARALTLEAARSIIALLKTDGAYVVSRTVEISQRGLAPKNSPALYVLALALKFGDLETRKQAGQALPLVARTGTHLFEFLETYKALGGGWGQLPMAAVRAWWESKDVTALAYQMAKYRRRAFKSGGAWTHHDAMHKAHPRFKSGVAQTLALWAKNGWATVGEEPHPEPALQQIWAMERAAALAAQQPHTDDSLGHAADLRARTESQIVRLIRDFRLTREMIPTEFMRSPRVWEALLQDMPMTAMVRSLGPMAAAGALDPLSDNVRIVVERLADPERVRRARLHPLAMLIALKTYASGHGFKGSLSWNAVGPVKDALNEAFYSAFDAVQPTGARLLLALDVSGSMASPLGNTNISCREGTAAMALATARVEPQHHILGFSHELVPVPISPRTRLDDAVKAIERIRMGGTDCALPMLWAAKENVPVDAFIILTDNETWYGKVHPFRALQQYREKTSISAKLIVVGMTASSFTLADPSDAGMLDIVGFDASAPSVMSNFVRGWDTGDVATSTGAEEDEG